VTRSSFQLPDRPAVVFTCFGRAEKLDEEVVRAWCSILHQVHGSVLWVVGANNSTQLWRNWQTLCGLSDRVIFQSKIPNGEHIDAIALADVALDTPSYNGGATSLDILYAGVPIVTMPGPSHFFAQRSGLSIANALRITEFVTTSWEEYIARAVELVQRRDDIQRRLCAHVHQSGGFFNGGGVAELTSALEFAWERRHGSPTDIVVDEQLVARQGEN